MNDYNDGMNVFPENESKEDVTPKTSDGGIADTLFDIFEMFVISLCAVVLIFTFGIRLCRVSGPSMERTLSDGQNLLISNVGYKPEAGDIVVFHQTENGISHYNEPIVKRVIATENQWVEIDYQTWTVTVFDENHDNGKIIDESEYINLDNGYRTEESFCIQVPEGHIFVLGDNRYNSTDSRSPQIGCVDTRRVLGKVILRITPFDNFGKVD